MGSLLNSDHTNKVFKHGETLAIACLTDQGNCIAIDGLARG